MRRPGFLQRLPPVYRLSDGRRETVASLVSMLGAHHSLAWQLYRAVLLPSISKTLPVCACARVCVLAC